MRISTMWWIPGAALLLFGFTIAVFPELLAFMVATAFMVVGGSWLLAGWAAQRNGDRIPIRVYSNREWPW